MHAFYTHAFTLLPFPSPLSLLYVLPSHHALQFPFVFPLLYHGGTQARQASFLLCYAVDISVLLMHA